MVRTVRLFSPLLWLFLLVAGLPAHGQGIPGLSTPAASAQDEARVDPAEAEKLIRTLEDPAAREALVKQLRTLSQVEKKQQAETPPETFGTRVLNSLSDRVEEISLQIAAAGRALVDTPRALRWLQQQVGTPDLRATWARLAFELVVVVAAGYVARWLMLWLLKRPRGALGDRPAAGALAKVPLLLARTLLDLLPVAAFAFAGYGALSVTDPPRAVRLAALAFLNSSLFVQVVILLSRALLSPATPNLRLIPVESETAHYLVIWIRRIVVVAVYGFFIAHAALLLGLPVRPYAAILKLVGLVVAAMLVVLVMQNRAVVRAWLRGERSLRADGRDAGDAALQALAAGEIGEAQAQAELAEARPPREAARAWAAARRRVADIWHVLTIVYVVVIFGIWALEIQGGFEFVLRGTLVTLVTLVVARLLGRGVDGLIRRGFAVAPDVRQEHPGLEARANRYLPILHRILKAAVWVLAALVVLQAWGADSLGWLASTAGQRVSASIVSILLILTLAVVAWEVVSAGIERYLTATDTSGQVVQRSARIRTLLPLLRNAFLVLLVTIVSLTVLSELGLNIAPLLAGAGVVGLAIGFGAQTLVKDVITGLFILFEDTIAVGDVVNVGGMGGVVEGITIRTIRLRGYDGTVFTVPFSSVTTVSNLTKDFSFAVFDVGVDYREDTDRVCTVLTELGEEMQQDPKYAPLILAPLEIAGVDALEDSAVVIKARFKTRPIQQWTVAREFRRRMKKRFDEAGINIPFPQRVVHVAADGPFSETKPPSLPAAAAGGG